MSPTGAPGRLEAFVAGTPASLDGPGFVHVLSARENPDLLKIGCTGRGPLTRAEEINSATGVMVPWDVRGAWTVADARRVEADVHALFAAYLVRKDREFFHPPFSEAARIIGGYTVRSR
ncbi:GIY-YIG nuclease family protein [Streptomyces chrestomyceticus]|uniref:GIY-YIG nuclease family protein n=1 Tax=Streptomyces chrestomyceticus TaxID=68185 RepID=UPI0033DB0909